MPRLLGIWLLSLCLVACNLQEEKKNQTKSITQPDSIPESGSSISPAEKLIPIKARLANQSIQNIDSQLIIRLELVPLLNKNKQREEAKFQLDTISNYLRQRNDSQSINFVKAQNYLGNHFNRVNDQETAFIHFHNSNQAHQKLDQIDSLTYVKSLVNEGIILAKQSKYQAAIKSYYQAIPLAEASIDTTKDLLARIYNNTGHALISEQKPYKAEGWFQKAIGFLEQYFPEDYEYKFRAYIYRGNALVLIGSPNEALKLYDKAKAHFKIKNDAFELANIYLQIGRALKTKEDTEAALDHYFQSIRYYDELGTHPYYQNMKANVLISIGNAYRNDLRFSEAHKVMAEAKIIFDKILPETHPTFSILYLNWGLVYYNEDRLAEAEKLFEQSLKGYIANHGEESPYLITLYYAIGSLYEKYEQWDKADQQYQLAINIAKKAYGNRHYYTAQTLSNMAELDFNQGKYTDALAHIQDALICLFPDLSQNEIHQVPEISGSIASAEYAISILAIKANILYQIGNKDSDFLSLETSHKTYAATLNLIDLVRTNLSAGSAKLALQEGSYQMYESAIHTAWTLYEHTEDEIYKNEAFYIAERSKANLLMEALQESEAKKFAGIPPETLNLESQIQKELNDAEKKIFDSEQGEVQLDSLALVQWQEKQFKLRQSYDSLKKSIETNYPQYYQLKYDISIAKIEDIQNKLPKETGLIEYFVGDSNIYTFFIGKNGYSAEKTAVNPYLATQVTDVREGISQWYFDPNAKESEMSIYLNQYKKQAENLYDELIIPIRKTQEAFPEKLIIIPDGVLGYLPFESLLTKRSDSLSYSSILPYWIKDHAISYAYSSTSWLEVHNKKHQHLGKNNLLAFAPSFDSDTTKNDQRNSVPNNIFSPLKYNQKEVEEINQFIEGDAFLAGEATLERFYQHAADYRMIHLASHGKAHDKDSRYSYIAFADSKDSTKKQLLYVSDLYNTQLNADLVVLSACETGLGKLYRGEGIASLARAFTYAGARSIATTLWRVDDQASSTLMQKFYQFLDQGFPKDEALRLAKLEMIEQQYDPFYWAGYIAIGEMEPLQKRSNPYLWLFIITSLIILAGVYILLKKRKKNLTEY